MTFTSRNTKASKLRGEQVLDIRHKYENEGYTQARLSREYQVSIGTIRNIVQGITWQHVGVQPELVHFSARTSPEALAESEARMREKLAAAAADQGSARRAQVNPPSLYSDPPLVPDSKLSPEAQKKFEKFLDFDSRERLRNQEVGETLDKLKGD